jgi:hypothetical protein
MGSNADLLFIRRHAETRGWRVLGPIARWVDLDGVDTRVDYIDTTSPDARYKIEFAVTEDGTWHNAIAVARPENCVDLAWGMIQAHEWAVWLDDDQWSRVDIIDEWDDDERPNLDQEFIRLLLGDPAKWLDISSDAHGSPDVRSEFEELYS